MRRTLLAAALLAVALQCCGAAAAPTPLPDPTATPTGTPPASSAPRLLSLVILGDSIGIPEMGCGSCVGFDQQYAKALEADTGRAVEVHNEARPNARIQDLQGVLDTESKVQAEIAAADIVVVTIGYNNGPNWDPEAPCHAPAATTDADSITVFLKYVDAVCITKTLAEFGTRLDTLYGRIEELAAGRPQVRVSLGVFANLDGNPGGDGTLAKVPSDQMARAVVAYNAIIDDWNDMDCAAAMKHDFVCGDIHHAFNGPDGTARVTDLVNSADFVHPNEAGQAKIAELLEAIDLRSITSGG